MAMTSFTWKTSNRNTRASSAASITSRSMHLLREPTRLGIIISFAVSKEFSSTFTRWVTPRDTDSWSLVAETFLLLQDCRRRLHLFAQRLWRQLFCTTCHWTNNFWQRFLPHLNATLGRRVVAWIKQLHSLRRRALPNLLSSTQFERPQSSCQLTLFSLSRIRCRRQTKRRLLTSTSEWLSAELRRNTSQRLWNAHGRTWSSSGSSSPSS